MAAFQLRRREHCDCKFKAAAVDKPNFICCFDGVAPFRTFKYWGVWHLDLGKHDSSSLIELCWKS